MIIKEKDLPKITFVDTGEPFFTEQGDCEGTHMVPAYAEFEGDLNIPDELIQQYLADKKAGK